MVDWQHVWPTTAGNNLKGDLRFSRDMLERIEKRYGFIIDFILCFSTPPAKG